MMAFWLKHCPDGENAYRKNVGKNVQNFSKIIKQSVQSVQNRANALGFRVTDYCAYFKQYSRGYQIPFADTFGFSRTSYVEVDGLTRVSIGLEYQKDLAVIATQILYPQQFLQQQ